MRRVLDGDPSRIVYRARIEWLRLMSSRVFMFFALTSLGLMLRQALPEWRVLPAIALFAFMGLLALVEHGWEFHLADRTYRRWWGLLVPIISHRGSFARCQTIVMEARWAGNDPRPRYRVALKGSETDLQFHMTLNRAEASRPAREMALLMRLPFVDRSFDPEVALQPERLDETIPGRARREGTPPVGRRRAEIRTRVIVEDESVRLEVPCRRLTPNEWVALLVLFILPSAFALVFAVFIPGPAPEPALLMVGLMYAMYLFAVFAILFRARISWTVEADATRLRLRTRSGPFFRTRDMPADRILELGLASEPAGIRRAQLLPFGVPITALSAEQELSFGGHLPREEKEWIRDVLRRVLSA